MTYIARAIIVLTTSSALTFLPSAAISAKAPAEVKDVVGSRIGQGERLLRSRGYVHIDSSRGDDQHWSYWWNDRKKHCISAITIDGTFRSIDKTSSSDCGHKNSGSGAAVAIGAAALIGALVLSHKSHHHSDGKHNSSHQWEADHERGYRDGLYNQAYHNYSRSDAYSQGYAAGVQQRNHNTSYRPGYGGGGGYRGHVNVNNLVGQLNVAATRTLTGRYGFVLKDKYSAGNGDGHYSIYWRKPSKQCISVHTRSGTVRDISSMRKRNCR